MKAAGSDELVDLAVQVRRLAAQVQDLADRTAIGDLIDRYLLGLDEGAFDSERARSVFTDDVELAFPPGTHHGLPGLVEFTKDFMGHWERTHHHASNYVIDLDGDRADVAWHVVALHVHPGSPPPPAPGQHFQLGGRFDGTAVRTPDGWRLRRLALRVIWTTGIGIPSIAATMARSRAADTRRDGQSAPVRAQPSKQRGAHNGQR